MGFFKRSRQAVKKWRTRALFIDLHKTKVTISRPTQKHVPPWIYRQLVYSEK